ncbi:uncharacterized protein LOC129748203 [Uranotaenia lowii]|uniref:uncharacterized protein LOC129748203 n=1 Tax=Uranotaenia lowii TaxID=190385 RepID=UPI0024794677|nr:uncharacterized protein LOC129748203 [Uranotaenia lowii]
MFLKLKLSCLVALFIVGGANCLQCLQCENCFDIGNANPSLENCGDKCGIWKLEQEKSVNRGCLPETIDPSDILKQCDDADGCNNDKALMCQKCEPGAESCVEQICDLGDVCFADITDDTRGCITSDTTDDNRPTCDNVNECNAIPQCAKCDPTAAGSNCPDDSKIEKCFNHGIQPDQQNCYRIEDDEKKLFQMGCTSDSGFELSDCKGFICKTCNGDSCNAQEFQRCNICVDTECTEVASEVCKLYDSKCYSSYDYSTDQRDLGCLEDLDNTEEVYDIVKICPENLCNELPFLTHLKCAQCDRVCQEPVAGRVCRDQKAEACYIAQIGDKEVRGCTSDSRNFDECIEFENCYVCKGDNCNSEKQTTLSCVKCDGTEECGLKTRGEQCFGTVNFYSGCYAFQNGDNFEKGCLSEYDDSTKCIADDENCNKCFGSDCNIRHCMSCTSQEDSRCVEGTMPRYDLCSPDDECQVFVNGEGYTVRGCAKKFPDYDCTEENNCKSSPDPNPDPYPENALKCFTCNGKDDCETEREPVYCNRNNGQGCYVIMEGSDIIESGCLADAEPGKNCAENENCYECEDSNCKPIRCHSCSFSGADNADCVDNPDESNQCLTSVGCVVRNKGTSIVRGCYDKIEECKNPKDCPVPCKEDWCNNDDVCFRQTTTTRFSQVCEGHRQGDKCFRYQKQNTLELGCNDATTYEDSLCQKEPESCKFCDSNFCNTRAFAECYSCTDCTTVEGLSTKLCDDTRDRCFTHQDMATKKITRGCRAEMQASSECYEGVNCAFCGPLGGCNKAVPLTKNEAFWCTSCRNSSECAEYRPAELCSSSEGWLYERCIGFAIGDEHFYKGCLSDGFPLAGIKNDCLGSRVFCSICDQNYCNADPLKCHECSTDKDGFGCLLMAQDNPMAECGINDHCVALIDMVGHLTRGCASKLKIGCPGESCCNDRFGCNSGDPRKDERLSCYQCEGESCLSGALQTGDHLKSCLVYSETDQCYTHVVDETTVKRGCVSDDPEFCSKNSCITCSGEAGCNNLGPLVDNSLTCIKCTNVGSCSSVNVGSKCENDVLLGESDYCYTFMFENQITVGKGCLSDLIKGDTFYTECNSDDSQCILCPGNNCNRDQFRCYRCSSRTNADCADIRSNNIDRVDCYGECVLFLDEEGYIIRDCLENIDEDECNDSIDCETCLGSECNKNMLPETRLSCYQCEGSEEDCLKATAEIFNKACSKHKDDDQCYTRFEREDYVTRGCVSDLPEDQKCTEPCITCDGDDCNEQYALQDNTLHCIKCVGESCEGNVKGTPCTKQILFGSRDFCYEYADKDTIQKGCLSDLSEDGDETIKNACDQGNCILCSEDNCNRDMFYCVTCDSETDSSCADPLRVIVAGKREVCEQERCFSLIDGQGITRKGCAGKESICEDSEAPCSLCEGSSLCNNVLFPADRILCYQCADCDTVSTEDVVVPTACQKYDAEDYCFSNLEENSVQRGCGTEISGAPCSDPTVCFRCSTNGCNDHPITWNSALSCVKCSGPECANAETSVPCEGKVTLGSIKDQCYSFSFLGEIILKGCTVEDPSRCALEGSCELCSCNGCNSLDQNNSFECFECSGPECGEIDPSKAETCSGMACITYLSKDGFVSRGCVADFQDDCMVFGSSHELCNADHCNAQIYPANRLRCHRCENCATDVPDDPELCDRYVEDDTCYTLSLEGGKNIARGCSSELFASCAAPDCKECYTSGCNDEPFEGGVDPTEEPTENPTDEPTDSPTEEPTESPTEEPTESPTEEPTESPTEEPTDSPTEEPTDSPTEEPTDSPTEEPTESPTDDPPNTTTGENTEEPGKTTTEDNPTNPGDNTLKCIQCVETVENPSCAWGHRPESANDCENPSDGCFSCIENGLTVRGCSSDLTQYSCSPATIDECDDEDGCNAENIKRQSCAICSTNCHLGKQYNPVEDCSGVISYDQRGCYTMRNERKLVVERGCIASLTDGERDYCRNRGDLCEICFADGCNNGTLARVLNGLLLSGFVWFVLRWIQF